MYTVLESLRELRAFWKENAETYKYTYKEFFGDVSRRLPNYSDRKITNEQRIIMDSLAHACGSQTQRVSNDIIHIASFHRDSAIDDAASFAKVARVLGYELNIICESGGPVMVEARLR